MFWGVGGMEVIRWLVFGMIMLSKITVKGVASKRDLFLLGGWEGIGWFITL